MRGSVGEREENEGELESKEGVRIKVNKREKKGHRGKEENRQRDKSRERGREKRRRRTKQMSIQTTKRVQSLEFPVTMTMITIICKIDVGSLVMIIMCCYMLGFSENLTQGQLLSVRPRITPVGCSSTLLLGIPAKDRISHSYTLDSSQRPIEGIVWPRNNTILILVRFTRGNTIGFAFSDLHFFKQKVFIANICLYSILIFPIELQ